MGRTALLFPGQGAQKVGMGRDLSEAWPAAARWFEHADRTAGFALSRVAFEGPEAALRDTACTQPALVAVSLAVLCVLEAEGALPPVDAAAGLSLGEYAACAAAGALSFEDALRAVTHRGRFMKEAADAVPSGMLVVIDADREALEDACRRARGEGPEGVVSVANLNAPGQVVVGGAKEALARLREILKADGIRKVMPLSVSGAFHTELMAAARERLAEVLGRTSFRDARVPVVANATARPAADADGIRRNLIDQMTSPVRWEESMRWLLDAGFDRFYEVGPGNVLAGLIARIAPAAQVTPLGTAEDVRVLLETARTGGG